MSGCVCSMCGDVKAKAVKHGRTEVCLSCFSGLQHKAPRKRDHAREEAGRTTVAVKFRLTEQELELLDAMAQIGGCSRGAVLRGWIEYQANRPMPDALIAKMAKAR